MPKYFRYFPTVTHNNFRVTDITKRTRFFEKFQNTPYVFLPYTITEEDRAEDVSDLYYGSVDYVWMIYVANVIIDPQFDWPMTQRDLNAHIEDKYLYECLACLLDTLDVFEPTEAEFAVLLDAYNKNINRNTIPFYTIKYQDAWEYIELNNGNEYLSEVLTNFRTWLSNGSYTIDFANVNDEEIREIIALGNNFSETVFGTIPQRIRDIIVRIPDKSVLKQELANQGNTVLNWSKNEQANNIVHYQNVNDPDSRISAETYTLSSTLGNNFQASDWRAVRVYDYEFEKNEDNRTIFVVDKRYVDQVQSELRELFT